MASFLEIAGSLIWNMSRFILIDLTIISSRHVGGQSHFLVRTCDLRLAHFWQLLLRVNPIDPQVAATPLFLRWRDIILHEGLSRQKAVLKRHTRPKMLHVTNCIIVTVIVGTEKQMRHPEETDDQQTQTKVIMQMRKKISMFLLHYIPTRPMKLKTVLTEGSRLQVV